MRSLCQPLVHGRREGAALSVTLVLMLILSMVAAGILQTVLSHRRVAAAQLALEQALYAAEAGLAEAAQRLIEANGFMADPATYGGGSIGSGIYSYRIQEQPGWQQFSLHATGTVNGVSRRIDVDQAYLPTFANYAMWSRRNGVMYFIPGEVFEGLVHSDERLYFSSDEIQGGPVFHAAVSTAVEDYGGSISHVTFHDGFERGVTNGSMADVNFGWLRARAETHGLVLRGPSRIGFNGDQLLVSNNERGWTNHPVPVQPNFLLYVADHPSATNHEHRRGTIDLDGGSLAGRMTLVSDDDMTIHQHIRYAQDPRDDDFEAGIVSSDALGLISRDDIWVGTAAPENLEVFGAILATGQRDPADPGSFGILDLFSGPPRGNLTLYGSLVQDVRGGVGTFNSSGLLTGYRKNYFFDPRFTRSAPPYYPVIANRIMLEGWTDGPVL